MNRHASVPAECPVSSNLPAMVVVPAKDEAQQIASCLHALAHQEGPPFSAIVLAINNTTDETEHIVEALRPTLPVPVIPLIITLSPEQASAGVARRIGMEHALGLLSGQGVLFTTDADGIVPASWLADNLRYIAAGADAVAGKAVLFPEDEAAIPSRLRTDDQLECAYALALDEIDALVDPTEWDPWPRHTEHSGASIAVRADAYSRAGGMPPVHLAEDRRFFAALRRTDARIRHAPGVIVSVSGRTVGRAEGGMADTIRRRLGASDPYLDTTLEPARLHALRATLRRHFRVRWSGINDNGSPEQANLAVALGLPEALVAQALTEQWFGAAWEALEHDSPVLQRRPVPTRETVRELGMARRILAVHRARTSDRGCHPLLLHVPGRSQDPLAPGRL